MMSTVLRSLKIESGRPSGALKTFQTQHDFQSKYVIRKPMLFSTKGCADRQLWIELQWTSYQIRQKIDHNLRFGISHRHRVCPDSIFRLVKTLLIIRVLGLLEKFSW